MAYEASEQVKRVQQCLSTYEQKQQEHDKARSDHNKSQIMLDEAQKKSLQAYNQLKAELAKMSINVQ